MWKSACSLKTWQGKAGAARERAKPQEPHPTPWKPTKLVPRRGTPFKGCITRRTATGARLRRCPRVVAVYAGVCPLGRTGRGTWGRQGGGTAHPPRESYLCVGDSFPRACHLEQTTVACRGGKGCRQESLLNVAEFSVCVSVPARPLRPDGAMSLDPARGAAPPHGLRHRGAAVCA